MHIPTPTPVDPPASSPYYYPYPLQDSLYCPTATTPSPQPSPQDPLEIPYPLHYSETSSIIHIDHPHYHTPRSANHDFYHFPSHPDPDYHIPTPTSAGPSLADSFYANGSAATSMASVISTSTENDSPDSAFPDHTSAITSPDANANPDANSFRHNQFSGNNTGLYSPASPTDYHSPQEAQAQLPSPDTATLDSPFDTLDSLSNSDRLEMKKRGSRRIWTHALEKYLFTPHEIATLGTPHRRTIYLASLEAHIDRLHSQLLGLGLYPIPVDELQPYKGLNCKTAKGMVAGLQHDFVEVRTQLLEVERATENARSIASARENHEILGTRKFSLDSSMALAHS